MSLNLSSYDITQLTERLNNLSTDSTDQLNTIIEEEIATDMTTRQNDRFSNDDLRQFCITIPRFSHLTKNLNEFISCIDTLVDTFSTAIPLSDAQHRLFYLHILSRIEGLPHEYIKRNNYDQFRPNFDTWKTIRAKLLERFGQEKDEKTLACILQSTIQKASETYEDYHMKINVTLSELLQLVRIQYQPPFVDVYIETYTDQAIRTFSAGVFEPYRSYLKHHNINTLDECLALCRSYDSKEHDRRLLLALSNFNQSAIPKKPVIPPKPLPRPAFHNFPNTLQSTNFPNSLQNKPQFSNFQNPQQTFPRPQPFYKSIQPRFQGFPYPNNKPFQPRPTFTNTQTFGTNQQASSKPYVPEPMSTSTIRSNNSKRMNHYNLASPVSQPHFPEQFDPYYSNYYDEYSTYDSNLESEYYDYPEPEQEVQIQEISENDTPDNSPSTENPLNFQVPASENSNQKQ